MNKIIFGYGLIEPSVETPSSQDTNYIWSYAKDYAHLKRHARTLVATECTYVFNFGLAKAILGVFLNDVNFVNCFIAGNTTDSWGTPAFPEVEFAITKDKWAQRYKRTCWLTGFNYQYMRLRIPTQTPIDALGVFRIGTRAFIGTKLEVNQNPTYPYKIKAPYPEPIVNTFMSGNKEIISQGDYKITQIIFNYEVLKKIYEDDLATIDSFKPDDYIIYDQNFDDLSHCYLCRKDEPITVTRSSSAITETDSISFTEVV